MIRTSTPRGWRPRLAAGSAAAGLLAAAAVVCLGAPAHAEPLVVTGIDRLPVNLARQPNGQSWAPSLTPDGRLVAFLSEATSIVSGDTNGAADAFLTETTTGATERISVSSTGAQLNAPTTTVATNSTGRYVVFTTSAAATAEVSGLAAIPRVFVRDTVAHTTRLVSVGESGAPMSGPAEGAGISADGRYVAFTAVEPTGLSGLINEVYVRDLTAGTTTLASVSTAGTPATADCTDVVLSALGRHVAFVSRGDTFSGTRATPTVFLRDMIGGTTQVVSLTADGVPADDAAAPTLSADGNLVAFESAATGVTANDANGTSDVFVRNVTGGTTTLVSASRSGPSGDGASHGPTLTPDGRYVGFTSAADDLVRGDTNGLPDAFVRELSSGLTSRVSVAPSGLQANRASSTPALSANGLVAVFSSLASDLVSDDTNGVADVFAVTTTFGTTRVSVSTAGEQAQGDSRQSAVSTDGRFVAFTSNAPNLVDGDTNNAYDVFVRDVVAGTTERVDVSSTGVQANASAQDPAISPDGRYVAFESVASTLVAGDTNNASDVFVHDRLTGSTVLVSVPAAGGLADGGSFYPALSSDGKRVAFVSDATNLVTGDTNGVTDVFLRDLTAGTTTLVSVAADGTPADQASMRRPSIDAAGTLVAFDSYASNLVHGDTNRTSDVFLRNIAKGTTVRESVTAAGAQVTATSYYPALSADGTHLAFSSFSGLLVPGDSNGWADVFERDLVHGTLFIVSVASDGTQANQHSLVPSISADGRFVAFYSPASTLVPGDTNLRYDVFLRDTALSLTQRVSVSPTGAQIAADSTGSSLSPDGRYVAFDSDGTTLVPGDTNNNTDVFRVALGPAPAPLNVLPSAADPSVVKLMAALSTLSPMLHSATLDNDHGTFSIPGCSTGTTPLPGSPQDYVNALAGNSFTTTTGASAGPLLLDCTPDAVTVPAWGPVP